MISKLVVLVDSDWLAALYDELTIANDWLAVVSTLAVDSRFVTLVETELENGVSVESVTTGLSFKLRLPVTVKLPVN